MVTTRKVKFRNHISGSKKRLYSAPQTIYKESFLTDPSMPDESIDCLSLNIASKDISANMPVMIWIHGGAYITGSSNSVVYDPRLSAVTRNRIGHN